MKIKPLLALLMLCSILLINSAFADAIDDEEAAAESSTAPTQTLTKDAIGDMLLQSVSLMGIPYRWGGNTPETGMDCSGFIRYIFKNTTTTIIEYKKNEKYYPKVTKFYFSHL